MRILVVAPHPDDEVLGMGGAIAKFADEGHEVTVATMTKAWEPLFTADILRDGRREQAEAHEILGVAGNIYADLPAAGVAELPHRDVNAKCIEIVESVRPERVFLPFVWDLHRDHRELFQSFMVALRPQGPGRLVGRIACYETVSETRWGASGLEPAFEPQWYVDISLTLERKLKAAAAFKSQIQQYPHVRSPRALEALARMRGSTVSMEAAESFVILRDTE